MKKLLLTALLLLTTNAHATIIDIEYENYGSFAVAEYDQNGVIKSLNYHALPKRTFNTSIEVDNSAVLIDHSEGSSANGKTYHSQKSYDNSDAFDPQVPWYTEQFLPYLEGSFFNNLHDEGIGNLYGDSNDVRYHVTLVEDNTGNLNGLAELHWSYSFGHFFANQTNNDIVDYESYRYNISLKLEEFNDFARFLEWKDLDVHEALQRATNIESSTSQVSIRKHTFLKNQQGSYSLLGEKTVYTSNRAGNIAISVNEPSSLILLLTATLFAVRRQLKK